jgi:hypothetical protein
MQPEKPNETALPLPDGWTGNEVAMVFDGETGNAIDAFDYTAEELRRRADFMAGRPVVTMEPSPWARLAHA